MHPWFVLKRLQSKAFQIKKFHITSQITRVNSFALIDPSVRETASKISFNLFVYYVVQFKVYGNCFSQHILFQSSFTKLYKPPVSKPKQTVPKKTQVRYLSSSSRKKPRGGAKTEKARVVCFPEFSPRLKPEKPSSWGMENAHTSLFSRKQQKQQHSVIHFLNIYSKMKRTPCNHSNPCQTMAMLQIHI